VRPSQAFAFETRSAIIQSFSRLYCVEHASCFRAGSKEETREAFQETKLQVLLV